MEVLCENYNIAIAVARVMCSPCSEPFSSIQGVCYYKNLVPFPPSLPPFLTMPM